MNTEFKDTIITILFSVIITALMVVSPLFSIFCSWILTYLFTKKTPMMGLGTALISFVAVSVLNGVPYSFVTLMLYLIPSLILYVVTIKKLGFAPSLVCLSIGNIAVFIIGVYLLLRGNNIGLSDFLDLLFENVRTTYLSTFETIYPKVSSAELTALFNMVKDATINIFPAFIVLAASIEAYILMVLARYKNENFNYVIKFKYLRLDKHNTYFLIFSYILYLFIENARVSVILFDVIIVFTALYYVCGLSVIEFFCQARGIKRNISKIIVAAAVILSPITVVSSAVTIFGFIDSGMNIRQSITKKGDF